MKLAKLAAALTALALSGAAQADLFDRGGGMIYDDDLNITWLADWNYAQTSGYDADGGMDWNTAFNGPTAWRTAATATGGSAKARALYRAVRQSPLFDAKLGMYRVNVPLDDESFEIGRSRIFSPGWLENESIFLHMHYKFMLETLRSGLAKEFFDDLRRGLIAFHTPEVYGRSPLENSSFIASSRFPDPKVHGVGFVARLSGATAEWISMVLHMGLGASPFRLVDGALRFEPQPTLADWLFTNQPTSGFGADSFGFKLFGQTWIVYENPKRRATFGPGAVSPISFELRYADGTQRMHAGRWLPTALALDVRSGKLLSVVTRLD